MARYRIVVKEEITHTCYVNANSKEDAEDIVQKDHDNITASDTYINCRIVTRCEKWDV